MERTGERAGESAGSIGGKVTELNRSPIDPETRLWQFLSYSTVNSGAVLAFVQSLRAHQLTIDEYDLDLMDLTMFTKATSTGLEGLVHDEPLDRELCLDQARLRAEAIHSFIGGRSRPEKPDRIDRHA